MSLRHYLSVMACFSIFLTLAPITSYGQDHQDCAPLTSDMVSWEKPISVKSAQKVANIAQSTIQIGQTVNATLFPARTVEFPVPTEERGGSVSYAGILQFDVTKKATYRVITNSRPWVEMVYNGKTITSTKHQHGAKCWGMEKMLDFPLSPGRHIIELTGNGKETMKFIILPVAE